MVTRAAAVAVVRAAGGMYARTRMLGTVPSVSLVAVHAAPAKPDHVTKAGRSVMSVTSGKCGAWAMGKQRTFLQSGGGVYLKALHSAFP